MAPEIERPQLHHKDKTILRSDYRRVNISKAKIYMSKIEKTLELNITHELLTLADSFWWYLSTISLRRYWRPHWRMPFLPQPKSFAMGLPINLEGRDGGGYDVCLVSPSYSGSNDRAVFMQFKAGEHKEFHSDGKSAFFGNASNPKPHVEFTFNNNGKKNQHKLLQDLVRAKEGGGHPVLYCFPRITSDQQVRDNMGKLLHKTSFISILDIDSKAALKGITINEGTAHKFRADYNNYNLSEVNLILFLFDGPDQTKNFISEIICVRIMRAFETLKSYATQLPTIYMSSIAVSFVQYIRHLANYFDLDFKKELPIIYQSITSYRIRQILIAIAETQELQLNVQIESNLGRQREIFYNILSDLKPYFKLLDSKSMNDIEVIPEAPSNFTFEINSNGLRFGVNGEYSINDFNEIGYTVI